MKLLLACVLSLSIFAASAEAAEGHWTLGLDFDSLAVDLVGVADGSGRAYGQTLEFAWHANDRVALFGGYLRASDASGIRDTAGIAVPHSGPSSDLSADYAPDIGFAGWRIGIEARGAAGRYATGFMRVAQQRVELNDYPGFTDSHLLLGGGVDLRLYEGVAARFAVTGYEMEGFGIDVTAITLGLRIDL